MAKKKSPENKPEVKMTDVQRTVEQNRMALKRKVRLFYDLQRLRLQVGGRTARDADKGEIILHPVDADILAQRTDELHQAEKRALKDVLNHLKTLPFYVQVLSDKNRYKGIGPTMAGLMMSEFDIHREEMPSQMVSFAGLAPVQALRCKNCQRIVIEAKNTNDKQFGYVHEQAAPRPKKPGEEAIEKPTKTCGYGKFVPKDGTYESGQAMRPTKGEKLPYNKFLKTKLVGVLGPVMLKLKSPWTHFYYDYKQRWLNAGKGVSDLHRHNAAIRYMIKMLLLQFYLDWRTFEKLPVRKSYQEEYLHHTPSAGSFQPIDILRSLAERNPQAEEETMDAEIAAEMETLDETA